MLTTVPQARQTTMPFPAWKHRPGSSGTDKTKAADKAALVTIKAMLPPRFYEGVPVTEPAFLYGLDLHNHGYFWESHEIWEAIWIIAPQNGPDRLALRALIQITNAGLKCALNRPRACQKLLMEAIALLDELAVRKTLDQTWMGSQTNMLSVADAIDVASLRRLFEERRPFHGLAATDMTWNLGVTLFHKT